MATLQHLPHLGTAEDDVLFVEWLVAIGDRVAAGAPIATVETLKAAFEVEAEHTGVLLRTLCEAGQRVPAQAPIAVLGEVGEPCDDAAVATLLANGAGASAPPAAPVGAPAIAPAIAPQPFAATGTNAPIAPAARRRAAELGLDLAAVAGTGPDGLVRVTDVERAHAERGAGDGLLDPEFLAHVRADRAAFAALRSAFKVQLYRRHGAVIADGCRFADGALLLAECIVLGDGACFGRDTAVEAREVRAGSLLHFGARCRVRGTRLVFGDNAFFADDVEIGGGGAMDPEAELIVGSHGFVGEHAHLNPCRTLRLGDEVVISRSAVLMTHSFGPSWLRGYPSRFAGVTVGDGAQIGIGAVLFPGVEIGAGAVVLSGSSVVTAVPPGRLFGGVPATDQKAAAQQLTPAELRERARWLVVEFARQLQLRDRDVSTEQIGDATVVEVQDGSHRHRLEFAADGAFGPAVPTAERVCVAVAFDDTAFAAADPDTTAISLEPPRIRGPIGPLAAAFREFLRKRGVRLHPRAWAYTGGWL